MKLRKGQLRRYFLWIDTPGLWWNESKRVWQENIDDRHIFSSGCHCKTVRSFRKHLKKHPELNGKEIRLANRYVGQDIVVRVRSRSDRASSRG